MKYRHLFAAAILLLASFNSFAQHKKIRLAHIGLIYPISSNGINAREYTNIMSFHAIAGVSGSERGICASGVSNIIYNNAHGAIFAGFSNHMLNKATGVQAAGFMNTVRNNAKGFQAAGFVNLTGGITGCQAGGFCNIALNNARGFQAAGFCNLSTCNVEGVQAAGFLNMADNVSGAQVAGFINVADDVNTQAAGFINVARKVSGVQMAGFMNIAEHSDYPIGIVNLIKDGTKAIGATMDENGTLLASLRSGGRVLYGVVGVGYNFRAKDMVYAMEAGVGAHIPVTGYFQVNVEGVSETLADLHGEAYFKSSLRVLPALMFGKTVEIFAGPTFSHVVTDRYNTIDLPDNYIWSHAGNNSFNALYIGAIGGVQFHF